MSDNIPFEIQTEIIHRISDTKSVIRYRSVSKAWKSVIDSKDFVTAHTLRHHQANRHLLIGKQDYGKNSINYVSIVDNDTFPNQKLSVFVPDSIDKFNLDSTIVGSSHGLFCLFVSKTDTAVIWNPLIRITIDIAVPNVLGEPYYTTVVGFGVCPRNLDPKLVKVTCVSDLSRLGYANASTQVEVFTLSSGGAWRSPLSSNLPHESIGFGDSQVVIDGFIYWHAFDWIIVGCAFRKRNLIMSFDLTSEEFTKVNLPGPLAALNNLDARFPLYNLRESLAVLDLESHRVFNREFNRYNYLRRIYHVWMMIGDGCTRSFNKLYSIDTPDASIHTTLGFRKSGAHIIEVKNDKEDYYKYELAIYEPKSKSNTHIGIYGLHGTFFVHSYMETLLLFGH